MSSTNELWNSTTEKDWLAALDKYWSYVKQDRHLVDIGILIQWGL